MLIIKLFFTISSICPFISFFSFPPFSPLLLFLLYSLISFSLLRVNLFQQSVGMSPLVHHVEYIAYVYTDTARQFLVEIDVA